MLFLFYLKSSQAIKQKKEVMKIYVRELGSIGVYLFINNIWLVFINLKIT
jgi:hypothetical protein